MTDGAQRLGGASLRGQAGLGERHPLVRLHVPVRSRR